VIQEDITPPVINLPKDITMEAAGPEGALVSFEATASDDFSGQVPVTCNPESGSIFPLGTTEVKCSATDAAGNTAQDIIKITVSDTTPPLITCPLDTSIECGQSPDPAITGSASATDVCDSSLDINSSDSIAPGTCSEEKTITRTWTATDDSGNSSRCVQTIEIVDSTTPEIQCNAPSTITPREAPISFTATASDNCAGEPFVEIIGYDCFAFTKKGKRIDKKESCIIKVNGDTIIVVDSGGVDDNITWTVRATDNCGNITETTCSVMVVKPSKP